MPDLISPLELHEEQQEPPADGPPELVADLEAVRDLVLRAHPDVVPELVAGDSIADLLASVEPAKNAYERLSDAWEAERPAASAVPAGGGATLAVDPERIPAAEKIRRGLISAPARREG